MFSHILDRMKHWRCKQNIFSHVAANGNIGNACIMFFASQQEGKNTDTAFRIIFYVTARRKSWQNVFLVWAKCKHWQCAARCILLFLVYSTKGLGQIWEFSVGICTLCCEARPTSTFSGFMSLQQPSHAYYPICRCNYSPKLGLDRGRSDWRYFISLNPSPH
jgi:hypothetical protein